MLNTIHGLRRTLGAVRGRAFALLTGLMMALAACAFSVQLVGDYDALVDEAVMQLQSDTSSFYASYAGATPPTPAAHDAFFAKAQGTVDALVTRATVLESTVKRKPLGENLGELKIQLQEAAAMDLTKAPLRESSGKALALSFNALQTQLVWMKKTQTSTPAPAGQ